MPESFSDQLRRWQQRRGLTCRQAAQALAVSPRTLEAWLQGRPCGQSAMVLRIIELIERTDGAAAWNDTRVKQLTAENRQLRELVACLLHNDPGDMAADAVTVLDAWRKDAARVLGHTPSAFKSRNTVRV